jgi:hypothetical protein
MTRFRLTGFGRETNRKRVKIYEVENLDEAIIKASKNGTIVDMSQIEILPDIPATEKQIRFAHELGLKFSENISKKNLSLLLTEALTKSKYINIYNNLPPTDGQIELLKEKGIKIPWFSTRRQLSELIDKVIDKEFDEIEKNYDNENKEATK